MPTTARKYPNVLPPGVRSSSTLAVTLVGLLAACDSEDRAAQSNQQGEVPNPPPPPGPGPGPVDPNPRPRPTDRGIINDNPINEFNTFLAITQGPNTDYQSLPPIVRVPAWEDATFNQYPIKSSGYSLGIWSNHPMDQKLDYITQLVIVHHGSGDQRERYLRPLGPKNCGGNEGTGGRYFGRAVCALDGVNGPDGQPLLGRTQVLGPHFRNTDKDDRPEDDIRYEQEGRHYWNVGSWREGGASSDKSHTSPHVMMDDVISDMLDLYVNLRRIVITGHSAGGQFVNRYAATANLRKAHLRDVEVVFMPANPSSVFYIDDRRGGDQTGSNSYEWFTTGEFPNLSVDFRIPTGRCRSYNQWKYGLDGIDCRGPANGDYCHLANDVTTDVMISNIKNRFAIYVAGLLDNQQNSGLDTDCEANLLGQFRLDRLAFYMKYWEEFSDWLNSRLMTLEGVGHSGQDVYFHDQVREVLAKGALGECYLSNGSCELTFSYLNR